MPSIASQLWQISNSPLRWPPRIHDVVGFIGISIPLTFAISGYWILPLSWGWFGIAVVGVLALSLTIIAAWSIMEMRYTNDRRIFIMFDPFLKMTINFCNPCVRAAKCYVDTNSPMGSDSKLVMPLGNVMFHEGRHFPVHTCRQFNDNLCGCTCKPSL